MKRRSGLRHRLQRQFVVLGLLPLLAVSVAAALVLLPMLLNSGQEHNLELATAIRDQVQQRLSARQRQVLQTVAEIAAGPLVGTDITAELHRLVDLDPLLRAAYVTDADGMVEQVALEDVGGRLRVADLVGLDQSAQPHYREARRSGQPVWSETFLSLLTGRMSAVLVVPFGRRTLFVELALDDLSKTLAEIGRESRTLAVILDRSGRIIGHPEPARAMRQESLAHLPLVQRTIGGAPGTDQVEMEGVRYLAHALPVQPLGWTILVMRPTRLVLAPLIWLGQMAAVALVGALGLSLLLARTLARQTGREVERLADAANAAAADVEPVPMAFSIAEFHSVWERLRELFAALHERDRLTEQARRDLQAVLDAATEVAIIATDVQGLVTVFSQGALKMLGLRSADIVGRVTPVSWHDPRELARRGAELTRLLGRPVEGFEVLVCQARHAGYEVRDWTLVGADGRRVEVSLAITAMRSADGALSGFLGVAIDISERRRADAMEVARRAAEEANLAKTEFLSRMSHELRTPLNAVLGYAQLMERSTTTPPSAEQVRQLQQIQRSGWHLVKLIDDVLDLSRIETGNAPLKIEDLDPQPAIDRAVDIVAPLMDQCGVVLSVAVGDGASAPPPMRADQTRVVQVLVNLLSNAAKYNHRGGQVRLECVGLGALGVRLSVADTGMGMDADQLSQLFRPFNRLGREGGPIAGSGIGLVITKRHVELMGGTIEVSSRTGHGTTVTVTLPAASRKSEGPPGGSAAALPAGPLAAHAAPEGIGAADARGVVLCIEDNADNARLVREMLRQRPAVQLLQADCLAAGLDLARRQRPDLILLDLHLPDARGMDVLAGLRAEAATCDVPIVVISADATRAQVEQFQAAGVAAYLTKPIDLAQTLATIDRQLRGPV